MGQFDIPKTQQEQEYEDWMKFQTSKERYDFIQNEANRPTQFSQFDDSMGVAGSQFSTEQFKTPNQREMEAFEKFKANQPRFDAGYNG